MGRDLDDVRAVRLGLIEADDNKIRRILAVVDHASDPAINRTLLDPLRPRLASLKPERPLRFARLLFIPLESLIVLARVWRRGDLTIPRSIISPVAKVVRTGLGEAADAVEAIIAGQNADAEHVITRSGEILWPRAAEFIASSQPPGDWAETGLSPADYAPLAACIAAVLRRATRLRGLARDEAIGALELDQEAAGDIARNIVDEPVPARAMVARLVLTRSPRAAQFLKTGLGNDHHPEDKVAMRQALDMGLESVLSHMEGRTGFAEPIVQAALSDVGDEVRRVASLLREIEADSASATRWPRVKAIRAKLDEACQERFARGMKEGLVAPLAAAPGPIAGAEQINLETSARDLRKLDMVARGPGGLTGFDRALRQGAEAVRIAAEAGTLSPMRYYRLIELLLDSDAAEAAYTKAAGRAGR